MSPLLSTVMLQAQTDQRLITLAAEGRERAFEVLVHRYRRQMQAYCRRMLLSDERAEDAIQQSFMSAWQAVRRGERVRDVRAWLYRITHNAAIDVMRRSGYDYEQLSESLRGADAPHDDLARRTVVREALAGLAALPELQREALMRAALDGQSHEEVAEALGVSDDAVRGLVYRARMTLRAAATAITPTPLLAWALASLGSRPALVVRTAEVTAGGVGGGVGMVGSAGLAGLLVKGGAVALTAGVLATTAVLTRPAHQHHAAALGAAGATAGAAGRVAGPPEALAREPDRVETALVGGSSSSVRSGLGMGPAGAPATESPAVPRTESPGAPPVPAPPTAGAAAPVAPVAVAAAPVNPPPSRPPAPTSPTRAPSSTSSLASSRLPSPQRSSGPLAVDSAAAASMPAEAAMSVPPAAAASMPPKPPAPSSARTPREPALARVALGHGKPIAHTTAASAPQESAALTVTSSTSTSTAPNSATTSVVPSLAPTSTGSSTPTITTGQATTSTAISPAAPTLSAGPAPQGQGPVPGQTGGHGLRVRGR